MHASLPALAALLVALPLLAGCAMPDTRITATLAGPSVACADPASLDARGRLVGGCNVLVGPGARPVNEPSLAISPKDPRVLVAGANDYNQARPWCGVYRSEDGGATWAAGFLPGYPGDLPPGPLSGFDGCGDAALAFAPDGTLYYAGIAFRRGAASGSVPAVGGAGLSYNEGASLFVARSTDAGRTWDSIVVPQRGQGNLFALSTPAGTGGLDANPAFHDKEFIAVAPDGTLAMTWTNFAFVGAGASGLPPTDPVVERATIRLTESRDRGATWSEPIDLSAPGTLNQGSIPVFAPDGALTVAWAQDIEGFNDTRIVARSRPPGGSFGPPVVLAATHGVVSTHFVRSSSMPSLAVEPADAPRPGRLLATWAGNQTGDADVFASESLDGGATWSAPRRVNQDAVGNGRDQVFPWAAIGPDGTGHVLFLDGRDDPRNQALAAYLASEQEGGRFRETVLGDAPFLASQDGFTGANFLGDYLAAAASPLAVYGLWPDTRSARTESGDTDLYLGVLRTDAAA